MTSGFDVEPVRWDDAVLLLDQRRLPFEETWVRCGDVASVVAAVRDLTVRGAPAIGITAAYGMVVAARELAAGGVGDLGTAREGLQEAAGLLRGARPTAVNLGWALDRQLEVVAAAHADVTALSAALLASAQRIHADEVNACHAIGRLGAALVPEDANLLTHCNAGALATGGFGTALGVVRAAVAAGKSVHVWVDETRPVLQGARLTAWELGRAGIPNTLIPDGAAASVMARGRVDVVVVGADRIAANGDVANKIGTYGVALAAAAHDIPFLVAAPCSTVDLDCANGDAIVVEERDPDEVRSVCGQAVAPPAQAVANPAFDVTPAHLVAAIVTERGVVRAPYDTSLRRLTRGLGT
ncbi:MAG: S-methyl-5-thioribose-1-phosphate isomerase [Acidimicrobiia bacterium]|nr:S-methyl-5-thioribose-1-phosphate isomerase [Acidimicrobiia bacterium]